MTAVLPLFIPSPSQGVWHLGPFPVRGYALCIILGVVVAIWIGERRWAERGGVRGQVSDIAIWAVPFGLVGGRLYHVITDPARYFGKDGDPVTVLYIWQGGLGIWGAVALGTLGAWIACRRRGILLPPFADALAPGLLFAQAFGRWGNWFNNELYGRAMDQGNPFSLKIYEWDTSKGDAIRNSAGDPIVKGYFEPTFLYECGWDVLAALFVIWADRRFRLGHGRAFALYVMTYCIGRGYIETLRIDEANHILGLRLNVWTAILLFTGSLAYLLISARLRPGRDTSLYRHPSATPTTTPAPGAEDAADPEPAAVPAVGGRSAAQEKPGNEAEGAPKKSGD